MEALRISKSYRQACGCKEGRAYLGKEFRWKHLQTLSNALHL